MAFISSKLIILFIWACISTLCSANNGRWFWGRPNCTVPSIPCHKRSPSPPLRWLPPSRYPRIPPSRRFPPPPSRRFRTPPSQRCPLLPPPPPRRHLTPPSLQFPPPPPPSRRPRTPPPPRSQSPRTPPPPRSRRPRTPPPTPPMLSSPPPPSRRPRTPPPPIVSPPPPIVSPTPPRRPRTPPFQPIPPSPPSLPPPPSPSPSLPPSPQPTPQSPRKIIVGGSNQWQLGFDYTDWALKNGPFYVNDILVFKYDRPNSSTPPHNVYLLPNMRSLANCNFGKAKMLANVTQGSGDGFEFVLKDQNPYYFACGEGNGFHCKLGSMKFTLTPILLG